MAHSQYTWAIFELLSLVLCLSPGNYVEEWIDTVTCSYWSSKFLPSPSPLSNCWRASWLGLRLAVPKTSFRFSLYVQTGTLWHSFFIPRVHIAREWGSVRFHGVTLFHTRGCLLGRPPWALTRSVCKTQEPGEESQVSVEDEQWPGIIGCLGSVKWIHDIRLKLERQ